MRRGSSGASRDWHSVRAPGGSRLGRVRLRRLWNVGEQFLLAATAQNLKRLVRFLAQRPPKLETQVS
jgi:hypothetical protein